MIGMVPYKPPLAVAMCVYNAMPYLREAVTSVLNQSFSDFEFLIIDNASTDASVGYINSLSDPRIRLICNEKNMGLAYSRTLALQEAKASFLAIMDADDWAHPDRLKKTFAFLQANPEITVCGAQYSVYETGLITNFSQTPDALKVITLFSSPVANSTAIFRRDVALRYAKYYDATMPPAEDYDFWARLSEHPDVHFANLPDVLLRYRAFPEKDRSAYYALQRKNADRVRIRLLQHLDLQPAEEEMQYHKILAGDCKPTTRQDLYAVFMWIQKIFQANTQKQIYKPEALRHLLYKRFYNLCVHVSKKGVWLIPMYIKCYLYPRSYLSIRIFFIVSLHYIGSVFFPLGSKRRARLKCLKNAFSISNNSNCNKQSETVGKNVGS